MPVTIISDAVIIKLIVMARTGVSNLNPYYEPISHKNVLRDAHWIKMGFRKALRATNLEKYDCISSF